MPSAAVNTRVRGYDRFALSPRLDRGPMPSAAKVTRVVGMKRKEEHWKNYPKVYQIKIKYEHKNSMFR